MKHVKKNFLYILIYCEIFARVSVKKISTDFLKHWKYFSFRTNFFFFKIIHFRLFLVSKTYIFMHEKNLHKIAMSANSSGGGVKALVDASAKNAFFLDVLPCLPVFPKTFLQKECALIPDNLLHSNLTKFFI